MPATSETFTWFGGKAGVRWNGDSRLHLVAPDGLTYCRIRNGLRPVTRREANSPSQRWCVSCLERGQADV